jgi:hypothetical protein
MDFATVDLPLSEENLDYLQDKVWEDACATFQDAREEVSIARWESSRDEY